MRVTSVHPVILLFLKQNPRELTSASILIFLKIDFDVVLYTYLRNQGPCHRFIFGFLSIEGETKLVPEFLIAKGLSYQTKLTDLF